MNKRGGRIKRKTKKSQLHVRVYPDDHLLIRMLADRAGLTISSYILDLVRADAKEKGVDL